MDALDILLHFANFAAPALALALALPGLARLLWGKKASGPSWWAQSAINFVVGLAVLTAGLVYWGRDGKLAVYALLVLALASSQWLLSGGWRK